MDNRIRVESPGRINLIGEHTDYNGGFVLPAAINKTTSFDLVKLDSKQIEIYAQDLDERFVFDSENIHPIQEGWPNYIMGVVSELQKLGANITGFKGEFSGNVPIGSGMSSSASLECALAYGLNLLFELGLDEWQIIKACQLAEHNFVGTKCGIMDQFASVMGKKDEVILLDCQSLEYEYFPMKMDHFDILLLNTNVSHALATSAYNTRREECEQGLCHFKKINDDVKSLRDVDHELLSAEKQNLPTEIYRRCEHVINENERVLQATRALKTNNIQKIGKLMYESHDSLSKCYEVSSPELDFLVDLTKPNKHILGSRMMGGGFGGCTINIIEKNQVDHFTQYANNAYRQKFDIDLSPYIVSLENGASVKK